MKVMCIDASAPQQKDCPIRVKEGDVKEVLNIHDCILTGHKMYEFVDCIGWGFYTQFWIPLSDIDETEIHKERLLETI